MKWLYGFVLGVLGGIAVGSLLGLRPLSTLRGLAGQLAQVGQVAGALPNPARRDSLGGLMPDERVSRAVRERLQDRGLGKARVDITTVDGVVYLRGRVADADERTAVVGVARDTPGVERVVDELKLPEAASS